MTVTINGTTGIDKVAPGAVETADLPAGTVLQVVNVLFSSVFSTSSSSYVSTGLSASITPTSVTSKILITIQGQARAYSPGAGNNFFSPSLYKNGSALSSYYVQGGSYNSIDFRSPLFIQYLDSPSTTTSITYQLYMSALASGVYLNSDGGTSTITLMEIAA